VQVLQSHRKDRISRVLRKVIVHFAANLGIHKGIIKLLSKKENFFPRGVANG